MKKILSLAILLTLLTSGCIKRNNYLGYVNLTDKNHVFKRVDYETVVSLFNSKKDFFLYLGYPKCPWCSEYVPIMNDRAKLCHVKTIYYFNIENFRNYEVDFKNNKVKLFEDYENLINLIGTKNLREKIIYNKNNDSEFIKVDAWIYAPTLLAVKSKVVEKIYETVKGHEFTDGSLPKLSSNQKAILIKAYDEIFSSLK